jgi:hypothetical protein
MKQVSISKTRTVLRSVIRPADTTVYAAGDVVGNYAAGTSVIVFDGVGNDASGGCGFLMSARCLSSSNAVTKPDLQLFLFDTPIAAVVDNAAFAPTDAEMRALVGIIAFPTAAWVQGLSGADAAGNSVCDAQALWIPFNCTPNVNSLYGVLVMRNAYAPVSAEQLDVRLTVME